MYDKNGQVLSVTWYSYRKSINASDWITIHAKSNGFQRTSRCYKDGYGPGEKLDALLISKLAGISGQLHVPAICTRWMAPKGAKRNKRNEAVISVEWHSLSTDNVNLEPMIKVREGTGSQTEQNPRSQNPFQLRLGLPGCRFAIILSLLTLN
jgi:hypothetical protein